MFGKKNKQCCKWEFPHTTLFVTFLENIQTISKFNQKLAYSTGKREEKV